MTIQLGDIAPDFTAETTEGSVSLHEYLGDGWGILFSHPADFTPVCTTELGEFANRKDEFEKRNTKLIGVSVDSVDIAPRVVGRHRGDTGHGLNYPLVGDEDRKVANLYGMIHPNAIETATVRTVFIIGPDKKVKLTLTYPAAIGRNVDEIIRALDALQLSTRIRRVDAGQLEGRRRRHHLARHLRRRRQGEVPKGFTTLKPYLRLTPQPNK